MRARLAKRPTALVLGTIALLFLAGAVPLSRLVHQSIAANLFDPLSFAFAVVGLLLALRRPDNPIGWALLLAGLLITIEATASLYTIAVYRDHRSLPFGSIAVLVQPSWAPAILLFGVAMQLFPTGRLPVGRWRWVLGAFVAIGALWVGGALVIAAIAVARHEVSITTSGDLRQLSDPTGANAWWGTVQSAFFLSFGLMVVAWLARELPGYRRATGEHRQQLKWLIGGAVTAAIGGFLTIALSGEHGVAGTIGPIGITALPISIGIGVLKYRLYEIDRLISRTISYAIVTGSLVAVFLGLVVLTTDVLPFSSPVGVAGSTLAAAALFNPLRLRVQRLVDRRFNRARVDAELTVDAFARSLRDAVALEAVELGLREAVARAVEPTSLSVWLRSPG